MKMMNKKIAVVLVGGERKKALNKVLGEVAWVELRIDLFLQRFSKEKLYLWVKEVRKIAKGKIIGTVRWHREQPEPKSYISEEKRAGIYKEIIPFVDFIDVEVKSKIAKEVVEFAYRKRKRVILSYHNFIKTPSSVKLKEIYKKGKYLKCDILKIATKVNSPDDLLLLLNFSNSFLDNKRISVIITPMGVSIMERLMPLYFGSLFTYVSLVKSTAPGQPSYSEINILQKKLDKFK